MEHDILIVGGGPAGLAFARSLAGSGLRIAVVERQPREALAAPGFDGREIALTHRSIATLKALGAWDLTPPGQIFPLKAARVLNGASSLGLSFETGRRADSALGMLVSNHLIRHALFASLEGQADVEIVAGAEVARASADSGGCALALAGGETLRGRLLIAADSRFSSIRDQLGIGAEMKRLGRAMLVCRVDHERPHDGIATEWFEHGHTIAMLPLGAGQSSAVLTVSLAEAERLRALDDQAFGAEIGRRFRQRLGAMRVASSRHVYPLVTSYAARFAVPGAALIGDAAVGMHPVTAHGFNLGLSGQALLARATLAARRRGDDWAGEAALQRFQRGHDRACRPLFNATNAIVRLFTDDRPPARLARRMVIGIGRRAPLAQHAVRSLLLRA